MRLRTRLLFTIGASVGLVVAVGISSYWLNSEIEARVSRLRTGPRADLARIDARHHGLEIEGVWDERGFFIAREIDLLPGTRGPKLRGPLQAIDLDRRTVRIYGVVIEIRADTEFVDGPQAAIGLEDLQQNDRVEISTQLEAGRWLARKIKTSEIKISDKVKGTPSRVDLDRTRGELEVAGVRIVLPEAGEATANSALRELRLTTLMTTVLHEFRSAAHELAGRADGLRHAEALDVDPLPEAASSLQARLVEAGEAFGYYLDQLVSVGADPGSAELESAEEPIDSRLRLLQRQFDALEEQSRRFAAMAAKDQLLARDYLDKTLDPHIGRTMLPLVYALRGDAEERLSDQVREISAWARATTRVAAAWSALAVVVALLVGAIVWRSIEVPVRALHDAALKIGAGQLDTRVVLQAGGELGVLASAFNQMAEALAHTTVSVESLESIFDSITGVLVILDSKQRIENVNRGALELLGYQRSELLGRPFKMICSGASEEAVHTALCDADGGRAAVREISLVRRDGSGVPVSFSSAEIRASRGSAQGYVCIAQDLTERKAIEEQVRSSLREKELLLHELHHRVKNNMQLISSLLALQALHSSNPQVEVELEDSQRRIQSMALIHEQLHHSADRGRIDVGVYLESLVSQLARSFGRAESIKLEVEVRKLHLGIDQALLCGLIVNELVTNSLKHAFDSNSAGCIGVGLWDEDPETCVLEVWDDGLGIEQLVVTGSGSLGQTLVMTLTKQLSGRLVFVPGPGTRIRIEFPPVESPEEILT